MALHSGDDPFNPYPNLGAVSNDRAEYDPSLLETEAKDVLAEPEEPRPLLPLVALSLLLLAALGLRLVNLQVVEGTRNRVLAEGNRIRSREIRPPRGEIHDRHGVVLADTIAGFTLELYPAELPRGRVEREDVLAQLAAVTDLDLTETREELKNLGMTSLDPITISDQVDRETALVWQMKLVDLPGVGVAKRPHRTYTDIPGFGHLLGYVGKVSEADQKEWPDLSLAAQVGKTGLELAYEPLLQGKPGQERIEVDAKGRVERILAELPPEQGQTLTLSIDSRLEESLARHLAELTSRAGQEKAAAVMLDPKTGGVLASVSLPSFDPNSFVDDSRQAERVALLSDPAEPLLNRVIAGVYPSGSTIKPVIATAALTEGTITPKTLLDTSVGVIQIGQWQFPDWKVHGTTDVRRAIAESNDIFFYALGGGYEHIYGLGPDRLKTWLERFGFGTKTGIDLPGERAGLVPDPAWKKAEIGEPWYIGDSYHLAIGQGFFLTTPLQLATATAAIANGGQLLQPYLVSTNAGPRQEAKSSVAAAEKLTIVREGMRQTVTDGTARTLADLPIAVAGKTGTAQFGPRVDGKQATHSWFVGFAPYDDPQVVLAIIVEGGGESTAAAVPVAKAVFADWWQLQNQP